MKRRLTLVTCLLLAIAAVTSVIPAFAENTAQPDTWAMVDGLGRTASDNSQVGNVKKDKTVGMFYWPWHYHYASKQTAYNLTTILSKNPDAVNNFYHSAWGGTLEGTVYFWDQPLYGYYSTYDRFVIRKQAELLADAGVDVIIMDLSNGTETWKDGYTAVFQVFQQAYQEGVNVPQIAFLLNFAGGADTRTELLDLYNDIYKSEKYKELWFYWDNKPFIMADPSCLDTTQSTDKAIKNLFTFRIPNPTYYDADKSASTNKWGWLSNYPQTKYCVDSSGHVEEMAVGVAQNYSNNGLVAMNDPRGGVHGRSYSSGSYSYSYTINGKKITVSSDMEDSVLYGINFQQQWDYAIQQNPDFIFVTGWNEWVAGRWTQWQGTSNAFPDQFSPEYSRDIEPSSGILKDYYYCQLVENIRRYKGVSAPSETDADAIINIHSNYDQWADILPEYTHYTNNVTERAAVGYKGYYYSTKVIGNDITSAKVAFDDNNVYFMVKTAEDLTEYTSRNWMRLFIDTDPASTENSWEGFEYVLNRKNPTETLATLERSTGGWNFETVGQVEYTVHGNMLQVKIPRTMLGFGTGGNIPAFHFKWADTNCTSGNILDFYKSGDCAPGGRFAFAFDTTGVNYDPKEIVPSDRLSLKSGIQKPYISNGYLLKLSEKVSWNTLLPMFNDSDHVSISGTSGNYVGTGAKITLTINGEVKDFVTVIVLGDLNGDGVVSSVDYLRIKQNFNGNLTLSQTEEKAADIDSDGRITSTDYLKVKKHMAGTVNLYD